MRPLRRASSWVTTPIMSSGTSMVTRSMGSWRTSSMSRMSTSGLPTVSSNPSRRMVSTRTASCSSPRPCTSQASGRSVGCTRRDTLPTSSWSRRSFTIRAVSFEPSRPASADVLIPIVRPRLGSSTVTTGRGCGSSGSASVSPIVISGIPATAMMSPGPASSTGTRSSSRVRKSSATFACSMVPSVRHHATCWPFLMVPSCTRHTARRPR